MTRAAHSDVRLMLCEFLHDEICHREWSMSFPFLRGLAARPGVETRWLIAAVEVAPDPGRNLMGRSLRMRREFRVSQETRAEVAARIAGFGATHAVLAGGLPRDWRALLGDAPVKALHIPTWIYPGFLAAEHDPHAAFIEGTPLSWPRPTAVGTRAAAAPASMSLTGQWLEWLGVETAEPDGFLVEQVEPDFRAEHLDEVAAELDHIVTLVSGSPCLWSRRVRHDLLGDAEFRGCAFCHGNQPWVSSRDTDPLDLMRQQLEAAVRQRPPAAPGRRFFDVYDARGLRLIEGLAETTEALGLTGATLSFSARADEILRGADALDRALERFEAQGNRVMLQPTGIENFSPTENQRLNKGLAPVRAEEAVEVARRLELKHPQSLAALAGSHLPGEGEMGFILFTPWTRLEDIEQNLATGARLRFPPDGKWLVSSVLLLPGTAMTAMAEAQGGILCDRYEDPAGELLLAIPNHAALVLPWRFLHEEVSQLFRLVGRVWGARNSRGGDASSRQGPEGRRVQELFADDALFAHVRRRVEARRRGAPSTRSVAEALVRLLRERGATDDLFALVDGAFDLAPAVGYQRACTSRS